jgi:hypothetical protein
VLAVAAVGLAAALAEPASTAPATTSAPATSRAATTASAPAEGATTFMDDSKSITLKIRWAERTFSLVIRPPAGDSGDRFARAGISGLGSGETARMVTGQLAVDGLRVVLTATSGLFEYSRDGNKMGLTLSEDCGTITNDKGLVLRRQR